MPEPKRRSPRRLAGTPLTASLAGWLVFAGGGKAEPLPPTPVPVTSAGQPPAPAAQPPAPAAQPPAQDLGTPPSLTPPPPVSPADRRPFSPGHLFGGETLEDRNGTILHGDPFLEGPALHRGWFVMAEVDVLKPHIYSSINSAKSTGTGVGESFGAFIVPLTDPVAALDWVGSPRVQVGYRFAEGFGEVGLTYRSVVSEGKSNIPDFDVLGNAPLRSRLNVNQVDMTYSTVEAPYEWVWDTCPDCFTYKFLTGVRVGAVYFDSLADGTLVQDRVSNAFVGAGPIGGLELWRPLKRYGMPHVNIYCHADTSVMVGQVRQTFRESIADFGRNNPANDVVTGFSRVKSTQAVPTLGIDFGLSWTPEHTRHPMRFSAGYHFETWWYVGATDVSDASLVEQGFFIRGELGF